MPSASCPVPTLDDRARTAVAPVLTGVEAVHGVRILFAIESGSRAWGFPSPDSDYDCRFVFVRRRERYLSLWPSRDVLEVAPEGDLDVNGWDIGKALRLICKGNAVILEWLASPLSYREEPCLRDRFLALARRVVDRDAVGRHYLHLGEEQMRRHLSAGPLVRQKKVFYALRPAVAARWLRLHPDGALPPMDLPTLMAESAPPAEVADCVGELIARKAASRELGEASMPACLQAFLQAEFAAARTTFGPKRMAVLAAEQAVADAFFGEMLREFG